MPKDEDDDGADLAKALKRAKTTPMKFAVVMKGGTDGKLMLSKTKIPPAEITAAKKETGGSKVIRGTCYGEDGKLVFETVKLPPATLAKLLKSLAKRQAGLAIKPVCRLGQNPEDLADEAEEDAAKTAAAQAAAAARAAAPPKSEAPGEKKAFSPVQFAKWRLNWEAARKKVQGDMQKLHKAIAAEFSHEADLGEALATAVDELLEELNSDLDDALNAILNGKTEDARVAARGKAEAMVATFKTTLASHPIVKQVEKNKFMPLSIQVPVTVALKVLAGSLAG